MNRVRARKSLGQNFLVDANAQRRIVAALDPQPGEEILEIGPGTGALTRHLAGRCARLVAVELDERLHADLAAEFAGRDDVHIVHGDILSLRPDELLRDPPRARIVGNIPYNITTPLLFHLLARARRPAGIVIMVQREVADRILARPGAKAYGALTVGVRSVARVEQLFHVGRGAFRPVPAVDSTVLRITPIRPPPLSADEEADLRRLTRTLFAWRRKQIGTTLRDAPGYALAPHAIADVAHAAGIDPTARPERIEPERLVRLAHALRERGLPAPDPT
jgi:16S rRNA (adenine1518-N6/adenine1519-N6)-dimethyltransferase